jgi:peptidoglycan-associated lipoprotein
MSIATALKRHRTSSIAIAGAWSLSVCICACAHTTPQAPSPTPEQAPPVTRTSSATVQTTTAEVPAQSSTTSAELPAQQTNTPPASPNRELRPRGAVHVSDKVAKRCHMDFANVNTAPKFAFDRSDLSPADRSTLDQVARCVTTGPLNGRAITVVGHTDPRGTPQYNMALGERRASAASQYLENEGVSPKNVVTISRGKLDATGNDEAGWQRDRRVDIDLK